MLDDTARDANVSNPELGSALDVSEEHARAIRLGGKPFEVGHMLILSARLAVVAHPLFLGLCRSVLARMPKDKRRAFVVDLCRAIMDLTGSAP